MRRNINTVTIWDRRRAAQAKKQPRTSVEIDVMRVGGTDAWWVRWIENGRPDYGQSEKVFSKKEAADTKAVMQHEAQIVMRCSCGKRSRLADDHRSDCASLTHPRVVAARNTKFAYRDWIVFNAHRFVRDLYSNYIRWDPKTKEARGEEPRIDAERVRAFLSEKRSEYGACLRAIGEEKARETVTRVLDDMVSKGALRASNEGEARYYAPRT